MKRLTAICALLALMAVGAPIQAQADEAVTLDMALDELPQSLSLTLQTAYVCQGTQGVEDYERTRDLVTNLMVKMLSDDGNTAAAQQQARDFVTVAETGARNICSDTQTCWREFLKMPDATVEDGQVACAKATNGMLDHTLGLLKIIYKSDS